MEATTIAQNRAQATRLLNSKAKLQAAADMKNINTGKPISANTPKPTVKAEKKPVVRVTDKLDSVLHKGGTWAEITAEANTLGGNIKYTASVIKAHIHYRQVTQGKKDFLQDYKITDKGIEKVTKKGK